MKENGGGGMWDMWHIWREERALQGFGGEAWSSEPTGRSGVCVG